MWCLWKGKLHLEVAQQNFLWCWKYSASGQCTAGSLYLLNSSNCALKKQKKKKKTLPPKYLRDE